jgi:hypothetical protein
MQKSQIERLVFLGKVHPILRLVCKALYPKDHGPAGSVLCEQRF